MSSSESLLQFHIKDDEVPVLELRTNEFNMVTYGIKFFPIMIRVEYSAVTSPEAALITQTLYMRHTMKAFLPD